jgi:hypothetical protein
MLYALTSSAAVKRTRRSCVFVNQQSCHLRRSNPQACGRIAIRDRTDLQAISIPAAQLLVTLQLCQHWYRTAVVHIRYLSAPSLYLLLVCANTGTRMLLFLPLWGISSPRNPERNWQDTRSRTTFRQYTHYSAQQMCTAVSTCQQL